MDDLSTRLRDVSTRLDDALVDFLNLFAECRKMGDLSTKDQKMLSRLIDVIDRCNLIMETIIIKSIAAIPSDEKSRELMTRLMGQSLTIIDKCLQYISMISQWNELDEESAESCEAMPGADSFDRSLIRLATTLEHIASTLGSIFGYLSVSEDEGQIEAMKDWECTLSDGLD